MFRLRILILPLTLITLYSCKKDKAAQLVGKWQEIKVINPDLDATLQQQKTFADTVGYSTTAEQNLALYGVENIDTFKKELHTNLDSFRKEQLKAVEATQFDFQKNGIIYIKSEEGIDSCNWYLDDDGALILDEAKLKGVGTRLRMEIVELSDTLLKLQYTEKFLNSTAVFKPIKK